MPPHPFATRVVILGIVLLILCASPYLAAQDDNGPITAANKPGVQPFGSYSGSGPDLVNVFNGNLTIDIPLVDLRNVSTILRHLHVEFSVVPGHFRDRV